MKLTYEQFLWRWMRLNKICVLFCAGEPEAHRAYRRYRRTGKIPLTPNEIVVS
jgi:hypothetical protein